MKSYFKLTPRFTALALLLDTAFAAVPTEKPVIALQPLEPCSLDDIEAAKAGILAMYDVEVRVAKPLPLPAAAYYKPRDRYRAEKLLAFLDKVKLDFATKKIVGLTSRDISTTNGEYEDWGIFGLGSLDDRSCVVSVHRLRAGDASIKKMHERLVKVVNHEIGHTLGLDHCPMSGCLMEDGGGKIATVDHEDGSFCAQCAKRVRGYLRK